MTKSGRELEQIQWNIEYQNKKLRVFIADLLPQDKEYRESMEDRMIELENLVNTFWWVVIVKHIQNKAMPDYNTFIWWWRLSEIVEEMKEENANILIFWNILKSHQVYNINEILRPIWAKAWDRLDLILKIFERHANSAEAKLQIELAAIRHMWPRIFGMGMELSKQWWWIWTRWKWETNTEIMKRHLRKKEQNIKKDLDHYKKVRSEHRKSRIRKWLITVWIVWYTNAWKSTLINVLTKKWVLAEDKLFATLWTSVWKMWLPTSDWRWKEILINDTIWFIRDLPPELINAFSSTLEDSIESDLLLHVIDAGDPKIEEKIWVVDDILVQIWANQKKIYVINKIDHLSEEEINELKIKFEEFNPIFISAFNKIWLDELKERIFEEL